MIELIGSADAVGMNFGRRLGTTNTVSNCPVCKSSGRVTVYEAVAQWSCGCARTLPPLSTSKKTPSGSVEKRAA